MTTFLTSKKCPPDPQNLTPKTGTPRNPEKVPPEPPETPRKPPVWGVKASGTEKVRFSGGFFKKPAKNTGVQDRSRGLLTNYQG